MILKFVYTVSQQDGACGKKSNMTQREKDENLMIVAAVTGYALKHNINTGAAYDILRGTIFLTRYGSAMMFCIRKALTKACILPKILWHKTPNT